MEVGQSIVHVDIALLKENTVEKLKFDQIFLIATSVLNFTEYNTV